MKCPHCGFEDEGNFCSNCGKPLTSEGTNVLTKSENSIKLGFGKSSSANYNYVVELMEHQPTYSFDSEKNIHSAIFSAENNIEDFFEIFDYVKSWKSCFVEINGLKVPISKIRNGLSCFRERQKAYNPVRYCFGEDPGNNSIYHTNPLGCRLCGITNGYWNGGWYTIGSLSKSGIFTVDKNQIKHIVKNKIEEIGFCPVLNIDELYRRIDMLPNTINPKKDSNFEYITTWENDKSVATGIRMKEKSSGFVVKDYSEIYKIDLDKEIMELENDLQTSRKRIKKPKGCGCAAVIAVLTIIALILSILIML